MTQQSPYILSLIIPQLKYTKQRLLYVEMGEDNRDHCSTFSRSSKNQNRRQPLSIFSYYRIIDNTNSKLIRQKFIHSDMRGNISDSQDNNKRMDFKFIISTEDIYDAFAC